MKKILLFLSFLLMSIGVFGIDDVVLYTFSSRSWSATPSNWVSGRDGAGFNNNGIQVTTAATGANATSPIEFTNISKIIVVYNTNKTSGAGTLDVEINGNVLSKNWAYSSGDGRDANYELIFEYDTPKNGYVKITANTTTNSIYIVSVEITYEETRRYTVKWVANGDTLPTQESILRNRKVNIVPSLDVNDYCAEMFLGWTNLEYCDTIRPSMLFNNVEQSPRITDNTTFYSVFANFVK